MGSEDQITGTGCGLVESYIAELSLIGVFSVILRLLFPHLSSLRKVEEGG